jgi:hypothetical protein
VIKVRPTHDLGLGFLYVLLVPACAAVGSVQGVEIGGLRYTGWLWLTMFCCGLLLVLVRKGLVRDRAAPFPVLLWLPWLAYVWLSLLWVDGLGLRHIQDALQMTTPVVTGVAASIFLRTEDRLKTLRQAFVVCFSLLILVRVLFEAGALGDLQLTTRASALTMVLVGCVFVAGFATRPIVALSGWALCTAFSWYTGSRAATFTLLSLGLVYPLYRRRFARLVWALGAAGIAVIVFSSARFQARFFGSESGTLKQVLQGDFLSFGRLEAWPEVWAQARESLWFGAGTGSAEKFVQLVWPESGHVHNDYLRMIFEQGLFGLALFLSLLLLQVLEVRRKILSTHGEAQRMFVASYLGLVAFALTSATDNTLTYNLWYTNPLFAALGGAYGTAFGARAVGARAQITWPPGGTTDAALDKMAGPIVVQR